jgi:hypothetical protein
MGPSSDPSGLRARQNGLVSRIYRLASRQPRFSDNTASSNAPRAVKDWVSLTDDFYKENCMVLYRSQIREIFDNNTHGERRILTWRGFRKIKMLNESAALMDICRAFGQEFQEQQRLLEEELAEMRRQIEVSGESSNADLVAAAPGYVFEELRLLFQKLASELNSNGHASEQESQLMESIRGILERDQDAQNRIVDQTEKTSREQMDRLRRRLDRMAKDLKLSEVEVSRLKGELNASYDGGVASIYDSVQGLDDEDAKAESKRDVLSKLFESNKELRKRLK